MRMLCVVSLAATIASAQSNQSLNGKYNFRQVLLITDGSANVIDTRTGSGSLTFDGNGNFAIAGQQLVGSSPPASLSGAGTYSVRPGGFVTLSNPLRPGVTTINARLGAGALVGSSTEAGVTVFDLFVALPAPSQALSNGTLAGSYWISSLEFPNGGVAGIRDTNFKLSANGAGSFTETTVTGQAANLASKLMSQSVSPITYAISPDGTGTLTFPLAPGLNNTTQLIAGVKNIAVSGDGTFFMGGSTTTGGHGLVVGVKAFPGTANNSSWSGFYFSAGLRYDVQIPRLAAVVGSVNALNGNSIWTRRTRQSDGLFDASPLLTYNLSADGSGTLTSTAGHVNVASSGKTFATSGVDVLSSASYEIYFGAAMLPPSGSGVFLDPQRVLNAASFAPAGYPVSPGAFITLFGTGLGTQTATAAIPFPPMLAGVQVTVNGIAAPIYFVNPTQISAIVPYAATGSVATVVASVNGTKSNPVDVPLAATAPGIFSLAFTGLGDGAILHPDFSKVSASSPASPNEVVQVYLTGLGAVNPPVPDGAAAPSRPPFSQVPGPVNVYVGGLLANVQYKGLAPTLAGMYQLNVQIPPNIGPGPQTLAVQTVEGFTDMVNIVIGSPSP
jgi:uncharacterized protein (TIGR03437 family)